MTGFPESSRLRAELVERRGGEVDGHGPDLTLQDVHTARIGISLFLFFLALIGVLAGLSLLTGESDDDDSHRQGSDARGQMLDAKVAALGDNPAPPGYLPKPDDGRPRY